MSLHPSPTLPYSLTVTIRQDEYLDWAECRGYCNVSEVAEIWTAGAEDDTVTYWFTESQAWEVQEASEDEAFLSCCGDSGLIDKIFAFLDKIV